MTKWWSNRLIRGRLLAGATLVFVYLTVLGVPAYLVWFDPVPFHERFSGPYAASKAVDSWYPLVPEKPFVPGETMYVHREFCLTRSLSGGLIRRWLLDPASGVLVFSYPIEALPDNLLAKGCRSVNVATRVPSIPPGVYQLSAQWQMQVNPLRVSIIDMEPIRVTVDGRRGDGLERHEVNDDRRLTTLTRRLADLQFQNSRLIQLLHRVQQNQHDIRQDQAQTQMIQDELRRLLQSHLKEHSAIPPPRVPRREP